MHAWTRFATLMGRLPLRGTTPPFPILLRNRIFIHSRNLCSDKCTVYYTAYARAFVTTQGLCIFWFKAGFELTLD